MNELEVLTVLLRGQTGLTVTADQRPPDLGSNDEVQSEVPDYRDFGKVGWGEPS